MTSSTEELLTLSARLVELPGSSLERLEPQGFSLARLARLLEDEGSPYRVVRVRDAVGLTTPSLLVPDSGRPAIVWTFERGRALVEHADGSTAVMSSRELSLKCVGQALEPCWQSDAREPGRFFGAALAEELASLAYLICLGAVLALLQIGPALLVAILIDEVVPHAAHATLLAVCAALVALALTREGVVWLRTKTLLHLETRLVSRVCHGLFTRLLTRPWQRVTAEQDGVPLEALAAAEAATRQVPATLVSLFTELPTALLALALLAARSPAAGGVALAGVVVQGLLALTTAGMVTRAVSLVLERTGAAEGNLFEALRGVHSLRTTGGHGALTRRWYESLLSRNTAELAHDRLLLRQRLAAQVTSATALCVVISLCAAACLRGDLSAGDFVTVIALAATQSGAWLQLLSAVTEAIRHRPALRKLQELLPEAVEAPAPASVPLRADGPDAILVEEVWFRYSEQRSWVLRGESLRVPRGGVTLLRAASGSGKTTLLRLIAGLVRAERGGVRTLGNAAGQAGSAVCYLPQGASLLEGSIKRNLEVLSGASWERIADAAERTGLSAWLATLPMQGETVVAARGANVSGGERQLILLTAAVASTRPIVLLDEPFANMDAAMRAGLDLRRLFSGKTVLCVTHETDAEAA